MTAQDIDGDVTPSEPQGEKQEDPRRSVYVAARLTSGEDTIDCQILNISTGGAKLRIKHAGEIDAEVVLTIESHGTFPARVAWRKGDQMGLEFLGDRARAARLVWDLLENPDVEKESRRFTRTRVLWSGRLHASGRAADCRVLNISAFGARVRLVEPTVIDSRVTLRIERFGEFPSDVVWKDGEFLGISFRDDPEDIVQIFGEALPNARDQFET